MKIVDILYWIVAFALLGAVIEPRPDEMPRSFIAIGLVLYLGLPLLSGPINRWQRRRALRERPGLIVLIFRRRG